MHTPGYTIEAALYESAAYIVYRAKRERDNLSVLIKTLHGSYDATARACLEREYSLTMDLPVAGVLPVIDRESNGFAPWLVFNDVGGDFLRNHLRAQQLDVASSLAIGVELAAILGTLHRNQIVHRGLHPDTILVDLVTGHVWITGLDQAAHASGEALQGSHAVLQADFLPYVSPEQTGRINRPVDHRTDLYSLGVTLYQMLTGRPPFEAEDPLELVHAHVARSPTPPHLLRSEIPQPLSDLVMRLLAKAPEERYQSANGLRADLERCLHQWQRQRTIKPFSLGQHDATDRLDIPDKIYGRDREIQQLLAAFDAIRAGATKMLLVAGYSGVGKTSLIQQIQRPIAQERGYFISGKFDQFERNVPYSAIIQALQALVRQILAEEETQVEAWKVRLQEALGPNGRTITEVLPELEWIVGPQPPVLELGPAEAQNRFNRYFQHFLNVFARKEHPLVLVLDDLQWADSASLKLIHTLMTGPDAESLLLVGAYRVNEVTSHHPLLKTLDEIGQAGVTAEQVLLQPLALEHVREMISETLRIQAADAAPLADLVYEKTHGNPFFTKAFLKSLYEEGMMRFDAEQGWRWDGSRIAGMDSTENVVALMVRTLSRLDISTQDVLKMAACIGNRFDLPTLATVYEQDYDSTAAHLAPALREALIVRLDDAYAFYHDRIQEAAYALMPETERKGMHYRIGQLLLQQTNLGNDHTELPDRLFEIVNHLNTARELLGVPGERHELARLNLEAGRKAKASTAYRLALEYFTVGLALLDPHDWPTHYALLFALHREQAECESLVGAFDEAEHHFDLLLEKAQTSLEKAGIFNLKITQFEIQSRYDEAVQAGRAGLALFGIRLPETENEKKAAFEAEMQTIRERLGRRSIAELRHLPVMTDPEMRMGMKLLMTTWAPAYVGGDTALYVFISARMVGLSLLHGNTEESAYAYVVHGVTVGAGLGDYESGYEYGGLALQVNDQFNDRKLRAKVHHMFGCFLNLWRRPIKTCFDYSQEAYRSGLENGDFAYATYAVFSETWHAFHCSHSLEKFLEAYQPNLNFLRQIKNHSFADAQQVLLHWAMHLQGRTTGRLSLSSDGFDERVYQDRYQGIPFFETFYLVTRLTALRHLEAYEEALDAAQQAETVAGSLKGTLWDAILCFHYALTLAACYPATSEAKQQIYRERLDRLEAQMKVWADNCPENFLHQYLLIRAERARLDSRVSEAMEQYERAIEAAEMCGFLQHEALANELYAQFFLDRGNARVAGLYMTQARRLYAQWGAQAKVADLEERYPALFARPHLQQVDNAAASALDVVTAMKAAQVISGEMERGRLIEKLMRIVIESAGAQKGFFLQEHEQRLVIEAEVLSSGEVAILQSVPIEDSPRLSARIVHYVHRTGEQIVVADAVRDDRFAGDPYVQERRPRSILCTPVLHQGKSVGLLYLQNNLTPDAFTPDRIEVVRLLAAQAAISLENARLYEETRQEMAERKRTEVTLRAIVEGTASETGSPFFRSLVQHLAAAFGVRYAFAAECLDDTKSQVRTLAFWRGDDYGANVTYALAGTPCAYVVDGALVEYAAQVQELFPDDVGLVELGIESYLGIPLRDSAGAILGHLAVMDDKPMQRGPHDLSILKTFAARAGAEMERKRAEEALRESEERFRSGFEHASIGMTMTSANGSIFKANKAFCAMLGYTEDEVLKLNLRAITFPDDVETSVHYMREVVQGKRESFRIEKRYLHKEGHVIWALTSASVVRDAAGKPWYLFAQIQDITKRKHAEDALQRAHDELEQRVAERTEELSHTNTRLQEEISERERAEAALRESENAYRDFYQEAPNIYISVGVDGLIKRANRRAAELFGYELDEFIGRPILKLVADTPDGLPQAEVVFAGLLQGLEVSGEEVEFVRSDGSHFWGSVSMNPYRNAQGVIEASRSIIVDVTERKQVEAALRHRVAMEELIAQISTRFINLAPHDIDQAITEAITNIGSFSGSDRSFVCLFSEDGETATFTHEWCIPGIPSSIYLTPVLTSTDFAWTFRHMRANRVLHVPRVDEMPDEAGTCKRQLQAEGVRSNICVPMMLEGRPYGFLGFDAVQQEKTWSEEDVRLLRMMGESIVGALVRRQADLQLKEAKETAETANRAKSEFLANMSHELRTPLNAILGYAQILNRDMRLTETQRSGLDVIERSGEHLLTLINDILDLSKIEAGKLEVQTTEFHLPDFLRNLADMARIRAEQKGLIFLYEPLSPLPSVVHGDERRLRQILLNLLSNAVKFTEKGGVAFKVGCHEAAAGLVRLRFQVEDTGIGIAPEDLWVIFEPFQQAGNARHHMEGTGLGLTISHRLVRLMGGALHVESTPGRGSIFWVDLELPSTGDVQPMPKTFSEQRMIIGYSGEPRRILVVDDRWENRSVLTNLLDPMGFILEEAENGQEALDQAAAFRPDLVLMDLVMPVMDGFEATRRLRQQPGFDDMVIIALSASVFEHNRQQSREAGCADFLQKPVRVPQLLACLQEQLHLEWTYAEAEGDHSPGAGAAVTPAGAEVAVVPPVETLQKLHELALMGHVQGILGQLDHLDLLGDTFAPFTLPLRRMARDYDMKRIRAFLTPYLERVS